MGLTVLNVEIANVADRGNTRVLEFLVDSGAIYSVVPKEILEELRIEPITEQEFRLADGTKIKRKRGGAFFQYKEYVGISDVIFGEPGDHTLLGAFTLESLGLALDPLRRELRAIPMTLA
jgi:predicted aspartyl protease